MDGEHEEEGAHDDQVPRAQMEASYYVSNQICTLNYIYFNNCLLTTWQLWSIASTSTRPRRPRKPTRGILLDRMTRSMGRRMPVSVAEGNRRPNDPVQAAKLASEAGVIINDRIPILTHWKEYKKDENYYNNFVGKLAVSAYLHSTLLTLYCATL